MHSVEDQALAAIGQMSKFVFATTCAYRFKNELRQQLQGAGLSHELAQAVVLAMPVKMPLEGLSDAWLAAAAQHYVTMVMDIWHTFRDDKWPDPNAALVEAARALNLELS